MNNHIMNSEGDCHVCILRLCTEHSQHPRSAVFVFNDTLFILLCVQLPSQLLYLIKTCNFPVSVFQLYQL
jgi:hypothetical protein